MKRLFLSGAALIELSMTCVAQTPTSAKPTPKPAKDKTNSVARTSAPKADADIQKCIEDRLSSAKLKENGITVAVSGREATLTGTTTKASHKNSIAQYAKHCGATKVTNNISVQSMTKSTAKKPAAADSTTLRKP